MVSYSKSGSIGQKGPFHRGGKMGTPEHNDAKAIPNDMNDIVPTTLPKKTVMAIAVPFFFKRNFVCTASMTVSKIGAILMDKPRRIGRTTLLKIQNPA
jgi:hypothetical protein